MGLTVHHIEVLQIRMAKDNLQPLEWERTANKQIQSDNERGGEGGERGGGESATLS